MSLSQSQAVDVVGIGLENGRILLHNLRFDETVMRFQQDWGPVTSIAFRTGQSLKSCRILYVKKDWSYQLFSLSFSDTIHTMATSSPAGHIAIWDQDRKRLGTVLRHAHQGAVAGLHFIASQPLLLTSGPDNT